MSSPGANTRSRAYTEIVQAHKIITRHYSQNRMTARPKSHIRTTKQNIMNEKDTICALATAPGGAIATIRVSGQDAIAITGSVFSQSLEGKPSHTLHYGKISNGAGDVDDVLVSLFRAPHSYTGEDSTEISCHGSPYIIQGILELLIEKGARQALPGEFTQRAFLNGKIDLSQAEAVADLIASTNKATHQMAMSQMRGHFSGELNRLNSKLLHLASLLELELDFADQEVEFANRDELTSAAIEVRDRIKSLTDSFQTGNALKTGVPVAIIGAPNVGKSTLLNNLLGDEKAIVSNIQGTTRDLIEDVVQIQGITFRFIYTAGIRKTRDQIEKLGIERTLKAAGRARIVILLTEDGVPFPDVRFRADQKVLRVINKCDTSLPSSSFLYHKRNVGMQFHISAITGDGMPLLKEALVREAAIPEIQENETIVSNVRHYQALSKAQESICRVIEGIGHAVPSDLVAQDLRDCIRHLAEITGTAIASEDVLQSIFSKFCVGK